MVSDEPFFSLDWAPDAIIVTGLDGTVVHANPRAEDLFGYRKDELTDKPLELLIPDGVAVAAPDASPLQRAGRTVTCAHRDGTRFPATARWRPAPAGEGDFVVFSIRDPGDEEQRSEHADGDVELLSLFADDISESLQVVLHLCDSIRDRAPAEAATISEILGSVDDLLERLSRVGPSNRIEPAPETCRLGELIGMLGRELRPLADRKGLSLFVDRTEDEITTDPVLFREMIHALVANAMRRASGGRVDVRCSGGADHVRIEIADTSDGIAEDEANVLEGADPGDRPRADGLGLVSVHRLAQLLDCVVEVVSVPGSGSRLTVVAPRAMQSGPGNGG